MMHVRSESEKKALRNKACEYEERSLHAKVDTLDLLLLHLTYALAHAKRANFVELAEMEHEPNAPKWFPSRAARIRRWTQGFRGVLLSSPEKVNILTCLSAADKDVAVL